MLFIFILFIYLLNTENQHSYFFLLFKNFSALFLYKISYSQGKK